MPKAFCEFETCAKRLSELCALCERKNLPRLREKTPQQLAWVLSYREDAFYFSQSNTDEQNTQGFTETLSQPISQNLTATFSYKASVKSVCRRRSVESKQCAKRFCKICEFCEKKTYPASLAIVLFLTENTDEQNTQRSTETLSQPISQNLTATEASPHCPTPFKNMPFSIREHALQRPRTRPSWCLIRPFFNAVCNLLILCRLQRRMKHTYWTEL